jgi:hypothetical protein
LVGRAFRGVAASILVILLATGCDSDPSGPGEITGEVLTSGAELGGAVLQVVGVGIQGFQGDGGSRVYWAPMTAEDSYRVIVIQGTPGHLRFQVSVEDVGSRSPSAVILNLVDGENTNLPVTNDYRVRFSR